MDSRHRFARTLIAALLSVAVIGVASPAEADTRPARPAITTLDTGWG